MKNSMRRAMISTVCMLIVAVMSLTGVTYAWFTMAESATVDGITMNVVAADGGLQLSKDGGTNWANALDLSGLAKTNVSPCSSADGVNFFSAVVNPANDKQIRPEAIVDKGAYVIEVEDLMVRNSGYGDIVVDFKGTKFVDTVTTDTRDSSKAAKLAVLKLKENGDAELAEDWELLFIFGDGNYNGLIKDATSDDEFMDISSTDANYFKSVSVQSDPAATNTTMKFTVKGIEIKTETQDEQTVQTTVYHDVHLKLVVWLEGQDADCINQNAASGFALNVVMNATAQNAQ